LLINKFAAFISRCKILFYCVWERIKTSADGILLFPSPPYMM
jgi:hypothetical protein